MRAALSILGLVVVLVIVLMMAKQQVKQIAPPAGAASAPTQPEAVRQDVQRAMDQAAANAARAASEALP